MTPDTTTGRTRPLLIPEIMGFVAIIIIATVLNTGEFVYDEPYYLENVYSLKQNGLNRDFLVLLKGPAGPTHAVVQYIFSPVTRMLLIPVRLINPLLFLGVTFMMNSILRRLRYEPCAWVGIAIPMTAVCIGMALTEIPALFFLTTSIFLMTLPLEKKLRLISMAIAGLMLSFAILGRQPLLLVLPLMVLINGVSFKKIAENVVFLVFSLALPLYCFTIWNGIVPTAGATPIEGKLVFIHLLFALGYGLLTMFIIAPSFLKLPIRIHPLLYALGLLAAFALAIFTNQQYPILNTLAEKVLPQGIHRFYPHFCFALIVCAGLYFILVLSLRLYRHRAEKVFAFSLLAFGAILVSTLTIQHQFSSRYVFQAYPFLLIIAAPYFKTNGLNLGTRVLGILLGIASLVSYVH